MALDHHLNETSAIASEPAYEDPAEPGSATIAPGFRDTDVATFDVQSVT